MSTYSNMHRIAERSEIRQKYISQFYKVKCDRRVICWNLQCGIYQTCKIIAEIRDEYNNALLKIDLKYL